MALLALYGSQLALGADALALGLSNVDVTVVVTGLSSSARSGHVTTISDVAVVASGFGIVARLNGVVVWGPVIPSQTPEYSAIAPVQNPGYSPIVPTQDAIWTPTPV